MSRPIVVRVAIFLATVVASWGVLSLGTSTPETTLRVGDPATEEYFADVPGEVEDKAATVEAKAAARASVEPVRDTNLEIENQVRANVEALFDTLVASVIGPDPVVPATTDPTLPAPAPTSTNPPPPGQQTTPVILEPATLVGQVFIDVDADASFNPDIAADRADTGMGRIPVTIETAAGQTQVVTGPDGRFTAEVESGPVLVSVDVEAAEAPTGYVLGLNNDVQLIECDPGRECSIEPIGVVANIRPLGDVVADITSSYVLPIQTAETLAEVASDDIIRGALGEPMHLGDIRRETLDRIDQEFGRRITLEDLTSVKLNLTSNPPRVSHNDEQGQNSLHSQAAGEVVSANIAANYLVDEAETERLRKEKEDAVDPVKVTYVAGQTIVDRGAVLTEHHIDAINATSSLPERVQAEGGLLAVLAVLVGLLALYLSRFRPDFWRRPRMVALFGILVVMGAAAVRGTAAVQPEATWFVLPVVALGFMTAVLFDSRIGVLMALALGILAAVGTRETGVAVYAVLATLAPIPFVSAVSSRGDFRRAVAYSSLAAAVAAAATSWFFYASVEESAGAVVGKSAVWAFGISLVASLVGLAALQFFETAFDITTTLRLLDLTDRNHEALQMLQEKAFGTFNHSLMVGTLAHDAARAIGGNALLARAMAYYHDLGKTENPTFFIENQFGMQNPHDQLSPAESAEVIRRHVTDGIELARKYKIPSDIASGIVSHHGDGVMRYFYEKARIRDGELVDPADYRHIGHKPKTAESAIVMLADSLEAACRAVFQTEEPTPDAIQKVVGRVIDEKVGDGQLDDSPITMAELTRIRRAFLESLVGHYHQRIAYPNFPGS